MNTTLEDLAKEYEYSIKIQQKAIDASRKKLLLAQRKGSINEIKRLTTLLRVLYDEKSELEERAKGLRDYYVS